MNDIRALREAAEKATGSAWLYSGGNAVFFDDRYQTCCGQAEGDECCGSPDIDGEMGEIVVTTRDADAAFIALANPAAIIELLDRLKEAEEAVATERKKALEEAAKVAESYGDTWSGTRDVAQACQEAAVDEKVEEIAAAIRKLGEG